MSKERRREWLDVTYLEAGNSYRYPLIEVITIFFLYLAFSAVYSLAMMPQSMDTMPGPMWNGTSQVDFLLSYESTVSTFVLSSALEQAWLVLMFLMPILIAYTTARAFEDGSLRTLLSYPVRRSHLLLMRTLVSVLIIGGLTNFSIFLALFLFLPAPLGLVSVLSLIGTFWLAILFITSSVVFLSVLVKRMIVAAMGGVASWYGLLTLAYMPDASPIVQSLANPVRMMTRYILGNRNTPWRFILGGETPLIGDVYLTLAIMVLAIIIFLATSMLLFRRTEI
jgi:ABC-type transport system involved in multi-copper enzyme maturation permease subunit